MRHRLRVQRASDGRDMPGSPCTVHPSSVIQPGDPGPMRGQIDRASRQEVLGWAEDGDGPVWLIVLVNGRAAGKVLANRWRADVAAAGIGGGHRAFRFRFEPELSRRRAQHIEIWRERDGAVLDGGVTLRKGDVWDVLAEIGPALDRIESRDERRRAEDALRDIAGRG